MESMKHLLNIFEPDLEGKLLKEDSDTFVFKNLKFASSLLVEFHQDKEENITVRMKYNGKYFLYNQK